MTTTVPDPTTFDELCSYTRLERTWQLLREGLRKEQGRDCIDYLDTDMGRGRWLQRIRGRLLSGTYRPTQPARRVEAKANGSFRVLTLPCVEDLLVYRHLAEFVLSRTRSRQVPGTFFSRRHQRDPVGKRVDKLSEDEYLSFFEIWLRYHNYRKYIGLSGLYKFLVIADVSNFFDSIQHSLLLEYLGSVGLPREALGVLGQLIQVLRPESGHSPAPLVGIPVDSYDCSRILANFFLFEHDVRVTSDLPADAYTRYMDDQAIGVASEVDGRRVIHLLQESLNSQRLDLNSAKTRMFDPAELVEHYWLDENDRIDVLDGAIKAHESHHLLEARFGGSWAILRTKRRAGQWVKVAKRLYRAAALVGTDAITLEDCKQDLVDGPLAADHIFRYLLVRNRYADYISLFNWLLDSENSIYEDVEERWFEALLFESPPDHARAPLVDIAMEFCRGSKRGTARLGPRVPATLLLYWLGPLNVPIELEKNLAGDGPTDGNTQRAIAAVLCALQPAQVDRWLTLAAREPAMQVSHLIEWIARLNGNERFIIPNPLAHRRKPLDIGSAAFDARAWLRLEILLLSHRDDIRAAVKRTVSRAIQRPLRPTEVPIVDRIQARLS